MSSTEGRNIPEIHRVWGQRLRQLRTSRGLTLEQVGDRLGIDYQRVSHYELGKRKVPYEILQKASRTFDVPVWYFFEEAPSDTGADHRIAELLARWERLTEQQRSTWWSLARQQLDLVEGRTGDSQ